MKISFPLFPALVLASAFAVFGQVQAAAPFEMAVKLGEVRIGVVYVPPEIPPGGKVKAHERLDEQISEDLAGRLGAKAKLVQVEAEQVDALLQAGTIDMALLSLPPRQGGHAGFVATGYRSYPKAVIRSDTRIRNISALKGANACVVNVAYGARQGALLAGASLKFFESPSDALVAVREGRCDLGFIDSTVWQAFMKFPEWRKFSATLDMKDQATELYLVTRQDQPVDIRFLEKTAKAWQQQRAWQKWAKQWATDVAFDVYMDQEVPDCHG